jgi:enoyl-[acyl-carrier protein] reductase I
MDFTVSAAGSPHGADRRVEAEGSAREVRGTEGGRARPRILTGRKALVVGIANEHSIAHGCACAFRETGAQVAITYVNEKTRSYVEPIARALDAPIFMQLDVATPGQLEAVFERIEREWGRLDILVHSIAGGAREEIRGLLVDCSAAAFRNAMDISVHSFVRMAKLAAPLMSEGGTLFAMTYRGAQQVVPNYDVMGPVKAALEAACRYLACELRPRGIRVHAISPGPLHTRAATGLKDFDRLLNDAVRRAPVGADIDIMDIGYACAYLATPYARHMTGSTLFVDGGVNIMA